MPSSRKPKKLTRTQEHRKLLRENRKHYDALLAAQGGVCAICKKPPKERRLSMDHDHRAMVVRGLLCQMPCNKALAYWMTPEWLRAAADYLENPPMEGITRE